MKKTRRKFMAFLLSAMLLVTGTAMGTSPVSAADKARRQALSDAKRQASARDLASHLIQRMKAGSALFHLLKFPVLNTKK